MSWVKYFGLTENPFSKSLGFFNESKGIKEGLSRLHLLKDSPGFFHLYGENGVGKTFLLRQFTNTLGKMYKAYHINFTSLHSFSLFSYISKIIGLPNRINLAEIVHQIEKFISSSQERTILIFDDAQNLGYQALEDIRLLTSLDYDSQENLTIIFSSDYDFKRKLSQLTSLKSRLALSHELIGLDQDESIEYLTKRIELCGGKDLFHDNTLSKISEMSKGNFRQLNHLAQLCLICAASLHQKYVDEKVLEIVKIETIKD